MDGNLMNDDRIGAYNGEKPKLTIGGYPVESQHRMIVGIGNGRYVIVGYSDNDYQDEIEKLRIAAKPIVRKHRKGALSEPEE